MSSANAEQYEDFLKVTRWGNVYIDYAKVASESLKERYKREWNIRTDVSDLCVACQISHIEKYKNHSNVLEEGIHPWQVECKFIPKSFDPPEHLNIVKEEDKAFYRQLYDPVEWAEAWLGWVARDPHQVVALRCTARQRVDRWGRRAGKTAGAAVRIAHMASTTQIEAGKKANGEIIYTGMRIMVVTPFLAQILNFFEEHFIPTLQRNEHIHKAVVRYRKSPFYEVTLSNGAVIRGFTTGASSSGEARQLRGFGAHYIYLDEVDYMNEGDYKAIMPIFHEAGDRYILGTSTPTGKREKFYEWCSDLPMWKELYFPAVVWDNWAEKEQKIRMETPIEAEFRQEYMAEFVSFSEGVYQPKFISNAYTRPTFSYQDDTIANPQEGWTYSIGVDWNSSAGTEIAVVGLDATRQYWLTECINVQKEGWTQLAAINVIIDLVRRWSPQFIYVDAGFGSTQVEIMKTHSLIVLQEDPTDPVARMHDILCAFNFSSQLEISDPSSGELIKKYAKEFLVENSIRRFEEGRVHIPGEEFSLKKQLYNYKVERISQAGRKVYGQINPKIGDHRLDAFNLALVAFKLEMSDFAPASNLANTISRIDHPAYGSSKRATSTNSPFSRDNRYPAGYMEYETPGVPQARDLESAKSNFSSRGTLDTIPLRTDTYDPEKYGKSVQRRSQRHARVAIRRSIGVSRRRLINE